MREFARARGDRALEIESLLLQSTLYSTPTCFDRARAILLEDQAEGLASEIGDQKAEARALWNKLVLNLYSGELTEAIATGNRALELARRIGSPELVAYILGDLSRAKFNSEGLEESRLLEGEARAIWRSLDNKPMLADNLNMAATRAALIGEHERALALSDEGIEISKMAGSLMSEFTNTSMKFVVYFGLGDYVRALQIGTDLIRESKNRALDFALSLISSQVAWAYASIGSVDLAKRFASVARQSFSPTTSKFLGGWVWNVLAITHITLSDLEATAEALDIAQPDLMTSGSGSMIGALATTEFQFARGEFRLAVDYADLWIAKMRQLGIIAYLPDLLLVQAKSVRALGMNDRAIELLNEARVLAERIDLRRTLWKIYSLLFELELERANLIEAERFRTSACDVIGYIADHTPDELRVTFLSQPAVRTVMARS
jgi:tetratricopeptide (TPR) repeat protein